MLPFQNIFCKLPGAQPTDHSFSLKWLPDRLHQRMEPNKSTIAIDRIQTKNLRNTKCIDKQPDAHYFQGESIIIYYAILMTKIAFMYTIIAGDTIV